MGVPHPDVIKAFSRFRRLSAEPEIETKGVAVMFSVEDIFRAIRRDLGHKDALLGKGEILGIYINDIHKHV